MCVQHGEATTTTEGGGASVSHDSRHVPRTLMFFTDQWQYTPFFLIVAFQIMPLFVDYNEHNFWMS